MAPPPSRCSSIRSWARAWSCAGRGGARPPRRRPRRPPAPGPAAPPSGRAAAGRIGLVPGRASGVRAAEPVHSAARRCGGGAAAGPAAGRAVRPRTRSDRSSARRLAPAGPRRAASRSEPVSSLVGEHRHGLAAVRRPGLRAWSRPSTGAPVRVAGAVVDVDGHREPRAGLAGAEVDGWRGAIRCAAPGVVRGRSRRCGWSGSRAWLVVFAHREAEDERCRRPGRGPCRSRRSMVPGDAGPRPPLRRRAAIRSAAYWLQAPASAETISRDGRAVRAAEGQLPGLAALRGGTVTRVGRTRSCTSPLASRTRHVHAPGTAARPAADPAAPR